MLEILVSYKCKKRYWPNPEKSIRKILSKIPDEYLVGIKEVSILDSSQSDAGISLSSVVEGKQRFRRIEVNMGYEAFSGKPLFSILMLNIAFIKIVKKNYNDMTNNETEKGLGYDWMSLGLWQPLNSIAKMYFFLVKKNNLLDLINRKIDRILLKILGPWRHP